MKVKYIGGSRSSSKEDYKTLTVGKVYELEDNIWCNEAFKYAKDGIFCSITCPYDIPILKNDRGKFQYYSPKFFTIVKNVDSVDDLIAKRNAAQTKVLSLSAALNDATIEVAEIDKLIDGELEKQFVINFSNEDLEWPKDFSLNSAASDYRKKLNMDQDCATFEIRSWGTYAGKGLFLNSKYDWKIETDDEDELVLVPRYKKKD